MTNVQLSKISLDKVQHEVEYDHWMSWLKLSLTEEVSDENGVFEFVREKPNMTLRNFFAHPDLLEKFNLLRCHMALICEISPLVNIGELELKTPEHTAPGIYVTGVTLTGSAENSGVVLTGFKMLANEKKLNLNTPNVNLGADEYAWANELSELLDELESEARLAYTSKKRKIIQGSLFDENEAATDDEDIYLQGDPNSMKAVKKGIKQLANLGVELSGMSNNN